MAYRIENGALVVVNPATAEVVGTLPVTPPAEVAAAVARARCAFAAWSVTSFEERRERLLDAGRRLAARAEEIAALATSEMGKPPAQALGEARWAQGSIEKDVELAARALEPVEVADGDVAARILHKPLGVVGVITPWNFPVSMPLSMIPPALLMGSTVVFKPSEHSTLTGRAVAACFREALPEGVLEDLVGAGETGEALVRSDVDMVAFTGSREVGRRIMELSAARVRPLVLELGGKDPMIVLPDADLQKAAEFAVVNSVRNTGQVCVSTERIYVHESIAEDFEARVRELLPDVRVNLPSAAGAGAGSGDREASVEIGPLVSEEQRAKVVRQLDDARAKGARVEGGEVPPEPGAWLTPALVTGCDESMLLLTEETFGPVVALRRVPDAETAVRLANDTSYGLGATVWGAPAEAAAVAERLEAGMIGVNRSIGGVSGTPWVGVKQSGLGMVGSVEGMRRFAMIRKITMARAAQPAPAAPSQPAAGAAR